MSAAGTVTTKTRRHGATPGFSSCFRVLAITATLSASTVATAFAQPPQGWPVEDPPRPLPARPVKFPPYQTQALANGLQVVVVLHHTEPAVSIRLLVRAGSAYDPKDKLGLAHMSASLLTEGTTTKSAEQLADFIDFIGGEMGSGAGTDLSYVNMVVMKDSFEAGLATLSDVARHPAFAPSEIERERQQELSGLAVSLQDPGFVADAVFDRLVYGFHPYGLPQNGTPQTIVAITREDLVGFHDRYFAPNNAILAIVGDVSADEALDAAKKVFGDWEAKTVPHPAFAAPPAPTRRVLVVNKPDAVQTEVRVGNLGVPRKSADYMALNLAIRILGGEGSNRLHQLLRTERGLTYGAEADFDTLKEAGDIEAQTNTRSSETAEVLRLIVDEFWRLQRERVDVRELEGAKAYLTGSFPLTVETPDQIALQVLNTVFYDLPVDELQTFRERVNAVTVDDIQRVARQYLAPDRLSVALVGNAAAFADQLKALGFDYDVVNLSALDLTAANLHREGAHAQVGSDLRVRPVGALPRVGPAYAPATEQAPRQPPAPPIAPDEGPRAKALLDQAVAATGGLERLRGIRTIVAVAENTIDTPSGQQQMETTTYLSYPDRFRREASTPAGPVVQVFDGQHAWMKGPQGVQDAPPQIVREFRASLDRDVISLLVLAEEGTVKARALPDARDDQGKVHHALELSGPDIEPTILYIDPATGLVSKQAYVVNAPGQPLIEESFTDYRAVDGIQVAFRASVRRSNQQTMAVRTITRIQINVPIDSALFQRPSP